MKLNKGRNTNEYEPYKYTKNISTKKVRYSTGVFLCYYDISKNVEDSFFIFHNITPFTNSIIYTKKRANQLSFLLHKRGKDYELLPGE